MPDSFSPAAGLRVNPDGTVEYEFDGHLIARGLDLIAGDQVSPPADRRIRWHLDVVGGGVVAELYASDVNDDRQLTASVTGAGDTRIVAQVASTQPNAAEEIVLAAAQVVLQVEGVAGGTGDEQRVIVFGTGDPPTTVIDGDHQSSFLQLADGLVARQRIEFGNGLIDTEDGSGSVTVSHALGVIPTAVHVTGNAPAYAPTWIWVENVGSAEFDVHIAAANLVGAGQLGFYWTVLG